MTFRGIISSFLFLGKKSFTPLKLRAVFRQLLSIAGTQLRVPPSKCMRPTCICTCTRRRHGRYATSPALCYGRVVYPAWGSGLSFVFAILFPLAFTWQLACMWTINGVFYISPSRFLFFVFCFFLFFFKKILAPLAFACTPRSKFLPATFSLIVCLQLSSLLIDRWNRRVI